MFFLLTLVGCGNSLHEKQIADLRDRQENLEKKVADMELLLNLILGQMRNEEPPEDPNKRYTIDVNGAPSVGELAAPVTVIQAFEFACGYCYEVRKTIALLQKKYGQRIRVVYLHFLVHPDVATAPALATCAAHKQGKFFELSEAIWEKGYREEDLSEERIRLLSRQVGLDQKKFQADWQGQDCQAQLKRDSETLQAAGVRGTPTFFVNGKKIIGNQPPAVFIQAIDQALSASRSP